MQELAGNQPERASDRAAAAGSADSLAGRTEFPSGRKRDARSGGRGTPDRVREEEKGGPRRCAGEPPHVLFPAKQREDAFPLILNRLLTSSPLFLATRIGSSLVKDVL